MYGDRFYNVFHLGWLPAAKINSIKFLRTFMQSKYDRGYNIIYMYKITFLPPVSKLRRFFGERFVKRVGDKHLAGLTGGAINSKRAKPGNGDIILLRPCFSEKICGMFAPAVRRKLPARPIIFF